MDQILSFFVVEISYKTHFTIMFIELVNQCAHPIVPQLYDSIVKTSKDPGPFRVETQPYGIEMVSECWLTNISKLDTNEWQKFHQVNHHQ